MIVAGPASRELAKKVAKILKLKLVEIEFKLFPDGESYLRFKRNLKGEVFVIQTLAPPQDRSLFQLLLLISTAKELGAEKIIAVVPYLAYARQDKRFRSGEVISSKLIARLIEESGADELVTFNVHSLKALEFFRIKTSNLTAVELIADYFSGMKNPFVLAPDEKAIPLAKGVASRLGCEYTSLIKRRDRITGKIETRVKGGMKIKWREVIVVDDIISTGGTMINAIRILKRLGARKIRVACVHAILAQDALKKILKAGAREVVATDSIPSEISKISLASLIAKEIVRLML
jgi:ribose-phosphate pyrophosphokinase